jgi:Zn-dependent protease
MLISDLFANPLRVAITLTAFLLALSVHEASHALAALLLGDKTALREKRLTLNPLSHIDITGFLMLVFVGFGWGKPVPFNPYNLKWPRIGPTLVAAAGPLSNFLLSILALGGLSLVLPRLGMENGLSIFLMVLALMSMVLGLFNLLPIPPLDGSKALLAALAAPKYANARHFLETRGPFLLLGLVLFNVFLQIDVFAWIGTLAQGIVLRLAELFHL